MAELKSAKETVVGNIHPDVLDFTVGNDPVLDLELAVWDCLGTAAHVTMLAQMPLQPPVITADECRQVLAALVDIIQEAQRGEFTISAIDQDVHLAVERRLTERLGDLGRKVHTGRSRNDQVAVDLRLHARDQLIGLNSELLDLCGDLVNFGKRHAKVPMVGRTHLQPAMPSTVGLWASAYAELLLDDVPVLEAAYNNSDLCPLGSAAGYGVPLPINRALTASLLGFARPLHNVFHASNARGKHESGVLAACSQVMLSLSRLAEDLILFSMPEFGYLVLPPALCTGSSIMPQKYNPDVLELMRAKASLVLGFETAAKSIIKALPGGYNRDLQDTKELYMRGVATTRASLRIMALVVRELKVCEERLRAGFSPSVFATDRALELVASGMPFRAAYHHVRSNLDELESADPDLAVAAKAHAGGTAGLDWQFYRDSIKANRALLRRRTQQQQRCFAKLLGVAWPLQA